MYVVSIMYVQYHPDKEKGWECSSFSNFSRGKESIYSSGIRLLNNIIFKIIKF